MNDGVWENVHPAQGTTLEVRHLLMLLFVCFLAD